MCGQAPSPPPGACPHTVPWEPRYAEKVLVSGGRFRAFLCTEAGPHGKCSKIIPRLGSVHSAGKLSRSLRFNPTDGFPLGPGASRA